MFQSSLCTPVRVSSICSIVVRRGLKKQTFSEPSIQNCVFFVLNPSTCAFKILLPLLFIETLFS